MRWVGSAVARTSDSCIGTWLQTWEVWVWICMVRSHTAGMPGLFLWMFATTLIGAFLFVQLWQPYSPTHMHSLMSQFLDCIVRLPSGRVLILISIHYLFCLLNNSALLSIWSVLTRCTSFFLWLQKVSIHPSFLNWMLTDASVTIIPTISAAFVLEL